MMPATLEPVPVQIDATQTRPGQIPMPEEGLGSLAYWQGEIKASQEQIEKKIEAWRENLARYQNKPFEKAPVRDTIWVPKDFALTERKRSQLWFKLPELFCQPKPGQTPQTAQAAPVFAAVLNQKLGPDQFDADTVMTEVTFDAICPAGIMVSVLEYEATVDGEKPIKVGEQPDPNFVPPTLPGSVLGLNQPVPMAPIMKMAPNIIHERYRWRRVSPAFLIAPADWVGSKYDDAPFLGERFELDREIAKRRFNLEDEDVPDGRAPLKTLNEAEDKDVTRSDRRVVTGVRLEYKASLYLPDVKHPECLYELVIFDGAEAPAVHRKSPHQTILPTGQLSGDSLKVFTTRVGSVRTISDGKFPNSDCQQSRPQVDELSKGRTQMIQQRNRNIPMRAADKTRIDSNVLAKIEKGEYQEIILVDGPANDVLHEIARAQFPRENFSFNEIVEKDLEEQWALGANQLAQDDPDSPPTEASIKQRNTDARLSKEQQAVKNYFLAGVQVAATLIQRYADEPDYVEIVGPVGAQILAQSALLSGTPVTPEQQQQAADPNTPTTVAVNKLMVQGSFLWSIKPDSQLRTDMQQERQYRISVYNQLRRDPLVNGQELVKWVFEGFGLNGAQFMAQPQPPPEPVPSISIAVKGEDLVPWAPQYPNIVQLLTIDAKPAQLLPPQTLEPSVPHPGMMPGVDPLNKHQADLSGQMPGPTTEPNTGGV